MSLLAISKTGFAFSPTGRHTVWAFLVFVLAPRRH